MHGRQLLQTCPPVESSLELWEYTLYPSSHLLEYLITEKGKETKTASQTR